MFATVQLKIQKIIQGCRKYKNFTWMEKKIEILIENVWKIEIVAPQFIQLSLLLLRPQFGCQVLLLW